jgi:hypothetical protein
MSKAEDPCLAEEIVPAQTPYYPLSMDFPRTSQPASAHEQAGIRHSADRFNLKLPFDHHA